MHKVLSNPHILSPAGSVDMQWDYQGNQEEATGPGFLWVDIEYCYEEQPSIKVGKLEKSQNLFLSR